MKRSVVVSRWIEYLLKETELYPAPKLHLKIQKLIEEEIQKREAEKPDPRQLDMFKEPK